MEGQQHAGLHEQEHSQGKSLSPSAYHLFHHIQTAYPGFGAPQGQRDIGKLEAVR